MERNWHIVVTRSRYEKKSSHLLNIYEFETYLPLTRELVQWSDRKKWIEKPLFPGYLFIRFSTNERFQVMQTDGVARVVQFEGMDYKINESLIDSIKEYLEIENKPKLISTLNIQLGDNILIKNGPFKGMQGKITQIKGKSKVLIIIEAIGQAFVLELMGNDIEKVMASA